VRSILLLPLGNADPEIVTGLHAPLAGTFRAEVAEVELDLDLEQFFDDQRVQYNSTEIIHHISTNHAPAFQSADDDNPSLKILAVSSEDLFIPILTYVFGEAELGGRVSLVSYHRLQPQRYGLTPDNQLLASRLRKEAVHELGHSYGLVHCSRQGCVMHTSTYVEDIDLKGESFCAECILLLKLPLRLPGR
jgi:archaemetzincin